MSLSESQAILICNFKAHWLSLGINAKPAVMAQDMAVGLITKSDHTQENK